jgi:hypothetical protein
MDKIKSFKELRMWQKGIEIVKDVYTLTREFPKEEIYGLTAQMRRLAISIPSNIAEGFKRPHPVIVKEVGFISDDGLNDMNEKLDHVSKMMSSLLRKIG